MKKIFNLIAIFFIFNIWIVSANLVYPIQEMSKVDCRFQDFSTLWNDCKMTLPILNTQDYTKYKNDYNLYRRVYTILWWSTYNYGWDIWNWWHSGVDIASSKWTPVYSIADWKIVQAGFIFWWWNNIKILHTINGRTIYSNYSHLNKINVKVWDKILSWEKIWEVWSTGNSSWNHLHFQIDLAVSWTWPRYRSNCSIKNYDSIINSNICYSQLATNTIDPLLFLETSGAVVQAIKKEIISQQWLLSREEILRREIEDFLKKYNVKVSIRNLWWNIELWKSWTFRISVNEKRTNKPFTWSFPWDMNFKYDKNKLNIFPTWILWIEKGVRDFKITPKIAGKMSIDIYMWETFFKKLNFWVFDIKKSILPKNVVYWVSNNNVISENKKWVLYFKDNFGLNILWVKFDWSYTLKSENNSIKFCVKKANSVNDLNRVFNTPCREESFKNEINFSYSNTTLWILIFEYKVINLWINNLVITNNIDKNISTRKLIWINPIWLTTNYEYYNEIIQISQIWIPSWINKWYFMQNRELSYEDGINFIRNALNYKLYNCINNNCKTQYYEKIALLWSESKDRFSYFTRWEFLIKLWEYLVFDEYNNNDYINFRDLDHQKQIISKNVLKNNTWKDYFGQTRYFQPAKNITRWEWAFLLNLILE